MTRMRGIESGFAVVRSSRDGLLSVSDARGRVLSVVDSAAMPGASLSVSAPVGARIPTIYTRIGDLLGWVCVAGMLLCVPWSLWKRRRVMPTS
jgi:apolipoprotein N-acyltransferase